MSELARVIFNQLRRTLSQINKGIVCLYISLSDQILQITHVSNVMNDGNISLKYFLSSSIKFKAAANGLRKYIRWLVHVHARNAMRQWFTGSTREYVFAASELLKYVESEGNGLDEVDVWAQFAEIRTKTLSEFVGCYR